MSTPMATRGGPKDDDGKASITVKEIARLAGVSVGTVSHVLNGVVVVREPRRKRVLEVMEDLGYQPSQLARGLRKNSTNLVGMIIPDITNPFFPRVVRGAEDMAFKHGYRLVLCNADDDPDKEVSYLEDLRSFRPAGLLIIPTADSVSMNALRHSDSRTIFLDRCPEGWRGDCVMVDNQGGAYQAASHLLNLSHRRFAVIAGPLHLSNAAARLQGFQQALSEAGIKLAPEFIQEARFNTESGYTAAMRLLKMLPRPTAIFASNDLLASGAVSAVRQLGLRCPEDVSVVGFDNFEFAEHTMPALTTVHQSGYQIGAVACGMLLDSIQHPSRLPERVVLPTELKIRNSTMHVGMLAEPAECLRKTGSNLSTKARSRRKN